MTFLWHYLIQFRRADEIPPIEAGINGLCFRVEHANEFPALAFNWRIRTQKTDNPKFHDCFKKVGSKRPAMG